MIDLYRFYDVEGTLLYVGISLHAAVRLMDHRRDKSWWPEVSSITVEHLEVSRYDAQRIERRAINVERPRYNIAGTIAGAASSKFVCTSCGGTVKSWGYVGVQVDLAADDRIILAHRRAAEIAAAGDFDLWRCEHGGQPSCLTGMSGPWVVLDLSDVWALHIGSRPQFRHAGPGLRAMLAAAWEAGEL